MYFLLFLLCAVSLGPTIPLSILFSDTVGLCDSCHVKGKFSCLLKQHVIMLTDVLVYKANTCYRVHTFLLCFSKSGLLVGQRTAVVTQKIYTNISIGVSSMSQKLTQISALLIACNYSSVKFSISAQSSYHFPT